MAQSLLFLTARFKPTQKLQIQPQSIFFFISWLDVRDPHAEP